MPHEGLSIFERTLGGAEAGHSDRLEPAARRLQEIERVAGHQECQRRVEAAGDAKSQRRNADVLDALGQAGHLSVEDLLAALAELFFAARHEWMGIDIAQELEICRPLHLERDPPPGSLSNHGLAVAEAVGFEPIVDEAV